VVKGPHARNTINTADERETLRIEFVSHNVMRVTNVWLISSLSPAQAIVVLQASSKVSPGNLHGQKSIVLEHE
jgi:hypothetical protein